MHVNFFFLNITFLKIRQKKTSSASVDKLIFCYAFALSILMAGTKFAEVFLYFAVSYLRLKH